MHNYVFQTVVPNDNFRWVIFCTKCGHVAWYGNATDASLATMQSNLPRECARTEQPRSPILDDLANEIAKKPIVRGGTEQ